MKFLPLSDQDKQLLLNLHQFIYLSKEFIDKYIYIGNNEKNNYRRLSTLKKAGYITSFALPIHEGKQKAFQCLYSSKVWGRHRRATYWNYSLESKVESSATSMVYAHIKFG